MKKYILMETDKKFVIQEIEINDNKFNVLQKNEEKFLVKNNIIIGKIIYETTNLLKIIYGLNKYPGLERLY